MPVRLKSLELHGYKTFANRTIFEFAEAITAIVGPNGSGKSNIADSIRWVLGEQSFSLLRGKKTEDMIFSGSEQRSRASMASVMITFDNYDGWLPIDFNEVAITRRAYRDGTNEYLINGQRVRLKDIHELLSQSGLSERTYTIIGQGLVDAALALKAEDRRKLFEEAAGIGIYRSRRDEALHRLDNTRRNLERVEDILAELEPRLHSLERQARRAQEYEQIKTDLRNFLRDWYGYHWHREQKEFTEAREAARVHENDVEQARLAHQKIDQQLTSLRDKTQAIRVNLNDWHRQAAQDHSRREVASREEAVVEERLHSTEQQYGQTQLDITRVEDENWSLQQKLQESKGDIEQVAINLGEAKDNLNSAVQNLKERQAERDRVEAQVQTVRQQSDKLNNRRGQLQALIAEKQSRLEKDRKAIELSVNNLAAAESNHSEATRRYSQAQVAQEKAEQELSHAVQTSNAHQAELQSLEDTLRRLAQQLTVESAEKARIAAEIAVLDQAEAEFIGYGSGARLLLEAFRSGKLDSSPGALSQLISVPENLETAISAALGDFIESIVISNSPWSALNILKDESKRGILLPQRDISSLAQADHSFAELSSDGVIGVAADLIAAPADLNDIIRLLLGNVMVVSDRQAAVEILRQVRERSQLNAPLARVVTLDGEVYYTSGPIIAGRPSEASEQTLLGRGRRRKGLQNRAGDLDRNLFALNGEIGQLENQVETTRLENQGLVVETRKYQETVDYARLEAKKAHFDETQAKKQIELLNDRHKQIIEEISDAEAACNHGQKELSELEARIDEVRNQLKSYHTRLLALSLDDYQAQVSHWKTLVAVNTRAMDDEQKRMNELVAQIDTNRNRQQTLSRQSEEFVSKKKLMESKISDLRQQIIEINLRIQAVDQQMVPAEEELEGFEKELALLMPVEAAARQALSIADHRYAQMKIALARRQEAFQNLQHRIEEDFGLVAFEFEDQISGQPTLPLQGMVEQLPRLAKLNPELEEAIKRQRAQLRRIGPINPEAQAEYFEVQNRYQNMVEQVADLRKAEGDVRQIIQELDYLIQKQFHQTFDAVAAEFKVIFNRLFGGGSARLVLTDPDNLADTGIDIDARLPGRRTQNLSLLSGGERSLTATSLVFALLRVSPTPFCVLDEVDAMLDEANVSRFRDLLGELSQQTQFVIVTHNRYTVQAADVLYGITMGRDSASQVLSLKMDEVDTIFDR